MNKSKLTNLEEKNQIESLFELGIGYPEITLPDWIELIWNKYSNFELIEAYHKKYLHIEKTNSLTSIQLLKQELLRAVCDCLSISHHNIENGFVFYSGSHALERVITFVSDENANVILDSPVIDIIPSMIREHNLAIRYIDNFISSDGLVKSDYGSLINLIDKDTTAIILTSPNNPYGDYISSDEMKLIQEIAIENDVILIIDHCFIKVNPYNENIPILSEFNSELKWIMLWDTGKTFDLDDEKAGFLFCADILKNDMRDCVNVIQLTFPRRYYYLFTMILDCSMQNEYFVFFGELINRNIEIVMKELINSGVVAKKPRSGSFIILNIRDAICNLSSKKFCELMLRKFGVGLVPIESFFKDDPILAKESQHLVRLCVARDEKVLKIGLSKIVSLVNSCQ